MWRYELVRGELRKMSPSGASHGDVAAQIITSVNQHVRSRRLGKVYASETGFRISRNPDTVCAPDAAFVRAERVVKTDRFFEGPPDAAFEVVSPNDTFTEIDEKTHEWLRAGVRVLVIVDPRTKNINVHRENGAHATDGIAIDDVVPGWKISLAEICD